MYIYVLPKDISLTVGIDLEYICYFFLLKWFSPSFICSLENRTIEYFRFPNEIFYSILFKTYNEFSNGRYLHELLFVPSFHSWSMCIQLQHTEENAKFNRYFIFSKAVTKQPLSTISNVHKLSIIMYPCLSVTHE